MNAILCNEIYLLMCDQFPIVETDDSLHLQWGMAYKITKEEDQEVALTVGFSFIRVLLSYPFSI